MDNSIFRNKILSYNRGISEFFINLIILLDSYRVFFIIDYNNNIFFHIFTGMYYKIHVSIKISSNEIIRMRFVHP